MDGFELTHSYACGHKRTYWTVIRRRSVRHGEICTACRTRIGKLIAELDRLMKLVDRSIKQRIALSRFSPGG